MWPPIHELIYRQSKKIKFRHPFNQGIGNFNSRHFPFNNHFLVAAENHEFGLLAFQNNLLIQNLSDILLISELINVDTLLISL